MLSSTFDEASMSTMTNEPLGRRHRRTSASTWRGATWSWIASNAVTTSKVASAGMLAMSRTSKRTFVSP
jgi:hypothetical protein